MPFRFGLSGRGDSHSRARPLRISHIGAEWPSQKRAEQGLRQSYFIRDISHRRLPSPGKPPSDRDLRQLIPRRVSAERAVIFAELTIIFPARRFFFLPSSFPS
jgi:hypothetical protein